MTREEASNILDDYDVNFDGHTAEEIAEAFDVAFRALEQEPKQGHWIMVSDRTDWYDATFKCSCCDREIITPYELKGDIYNDYPYCHCGAKMENENKE
ncbi:MAG: hypothetical protein K6E54_00710 [Bacteroidaceae bacterium]|nr:hypothetical protein [Bacteroidaceae bacterium]